MSDKKVSRIPLLNQSPKPSSNVSSKPVNNLSTLSRNVIPPSRPRYAQSPQPITPSEPLKESILLTNAKTPGSNKPVPVVVKREVSKSNKSYASRYQQQRTYAASPRVEKLPTPVKTTPRPPTRNAVRTPMTPGKSQVPIVPVLRSPRTRVVSSTPSTMPSRPLVSVTSDKMRVSKPLTPSTVLSSSSSSLTPIVAATSTRIISTSTGSQNSTVFSSTQSQAEPVQVVSEGTSPFPTPIDNFGKEEIVEFEVDQTPPTLSGDFSRPCDLKFKPMTSCGVNTSCEVLYPPSVFEQVSEIQTTEPSPTTAKTISDVSLNSHLNDDECFDKLTQDETTSKLTTTDNFYMTLCQPDAEKLEDIVFPEESLIASPSLSNENNVVKNISENKSISEYFSPVGSAEEFDEPNHHVSRSCLTEKLIQKTSLSQGSSLVNFAKEESVDENNNYLKSDMSTSSFENKRSQTASSTKVNRISQKPSYSTDIGAESTHSNFEKVESSLGSQITASTTNIATALKDSSQTGLSQLNINVQDIIQPKVSSTEMLKSVEHSFLMDCKGNTPTPSPACMSRRSSTQSTSKESSKIPSPKHSSEPMLSKKSSAVSSTRKTSLHSTTPTSAPLVISESQQTNLQEPQKLPTYRFRRESFDQFFSKTIPEMEQNVRRIQHEVDDAVTWGSISMYLVALSIVGSVLVRQMSVMGLPPDLAPAAGDSVVSQGWMTWLKSFVKTYKPQGV